MKHPLLVRGSGSSMHKRIHVEILLVTQQTLLWYLGLCAMYMKTLGLAFKITVELWAEHLNSAV